MELKNVGIGITSDILTAADFGATNFILNVGNSLLTKIFKQRAEKAREIALNEMKRCERSEFDIESADQFVAIVYRYQRAALERTALLNLKILAKIMKGQVTEGSVFASEFNEFSDIITSLKIKEIVYLGTLIRLHKEKTLVPKESTNEYYETDQSIAISMYKTLVGTIHFPNKRDLISCETSLQRTAFIYPSTHGLGGPIFSPTSDLERLAELVEFEELFGEINI
ncbi:hypothetical protein [Colwellia sp. UCD-KL20]|uniref:hypothetical protein n=1 Tax=Colwellia sp. UCD-KL20 TaxID=1917165 RepID=UPI0009705576|nr:hypothetical protein [Colwellia sp. UCD-KL20]